ncbi:MAG: GGDEF domain-containing protein [Proteobacteria bacterium]|nr:GGDEF domain-containing protein [Pseudomonadota bacterium]
MDETLPKKTKLTYVEAPDYQGETTDQIDLTELADKVLHAEKEGKRACLVVLSGQDVGRTINLDKNVITIGRDAKCTEVLHGEGVSRFHARVGRDEKNLYMIEDLGSTNGTIIRGSRIQKAALLDGDKVLLGRGTVLKFMFQDDIDETYFREMYDSSIRDGLTGIYNRKYLSEKMVVDLSFTRRHHIPFTFVIFDIDHFKAINDTHGHQTGDQVLVSVARAVQDIIRTEDTIARYGGEEFAVIAQGTDFSGGEILGERIRKQVADEVMVIEDSKEETFSITISVGVATVHGNTVADSNTVVSVADENLYTAKRTGRNRVVASILE